MRIRRRITIEIKRGDIYYISGAGHKNDNKPNRPAVIVSENSYNESHDSVQVIYLTTTSPRYTDMHVTIKAKKLSTGDCRRLYPVAKKRIRGYVGHVSDEEIEVIDQSINKLFRRSENMQELKIFEKEEFGQIRTVQIDGEPWFVGKDVAKILGYSEPRSAVSKRVDTEDKGVAKMETPSGIQEMTIINESGLYALILSSKLPSAKQFKRWVTKEVLPEIRKTGGYVKPMSTLELMELHLKAVKEVDEKADSINKDLQDFKQDMPILGIEESRITSAVRRRGVNCLGGKETPAYKDKSLRGKVYADIYGQLKREFGVVTYKAIKRSQCDTAVAIVDEYELPLVLQNQIEDVNNQMCMAI